MFRKDRNMWITVILAVILLFISPASLDARQDEEESKKESRIEKLFKMSLEELMNVKVSTAGKTPEYIGDIPASVVLITREDIEMYGYRTLAEILENIPGLYGIGDYSETGMNFGVRGFWSGQAMDNMIVLVNGVHQVNDFLSNYPLAKIAVPVEAIDRIEVIRGPMSVVYGSGAFYGVINIKTNEPIYEPVNIISASAGSQDTKKLFVRAASEEGKFKYFFNASFYDTDGVDYSLGDMTRDPSRLEKAFSTPPASQRTGGRLEHNDKYFNFSGTYGAFTVNMSYIQGRKEFYFLSPSVSDGSYDRFTAAHIGINYRKELSPRVTFDGKFTYSHTRDSYKYDYLFKGFFGVQELDTNAWEMELNTFFFASSRLDITAGLYYRSIFNVRNMFDLPSFNDPTLVRTIVSLAENEEIVTQALFIQVDFEVLNNLKLVTGARLEHTPRYGLTKIQFTGTPPQPASSTVTDRVYDRDQVDFIPRLAVLYYFNDRNIFKFLYGKAINRPSFAQNYHNSFTPTPSSGEPFYPIEIKTLEPESIQTLELNYIGTLSSRFTLNASIFRNTLNNLITRVVKFGEEDNYRSWSGNAGEIITHGLELTLNAEPFNNFRIELSGTFQETTDKTDKARTPGRQDWEVPYSPRTLGYLKASYLGDGFSLAVTGHYVGSMKTFWDEVKRMSDGTICANRIGDKAPDYYVFGGNARINNLFVDGLFLNIRCSNLFNKEIRYPTFTNNTWADRGTIGIGRTFLLCLGYKF